VTAEAAQPPTSPLPIRPRPVSGETTFSYIRRLAVANHMRPLHLRRYLKDPGPGGGFRLGWLAALAGRPVISLQHALADQEPPAGTASRRPPDSRQRKRSKAELFTLIRRDAREHGLSARALAGKYGTGKRIVRQALRSPHPAPRKPQPLRRSRIDPFTEIIDGMLQAEMQAFLPKPRPVISIYRDLVTRHGADDVSYQMVRKYVGRRRAVLHHQSLSPAHQAVADHDLNRLRDLLVPAENWRSARFRSMKSSTAPRANPPLESARQRSQHRERQRRRMVPAPPRYPCRGRPAYPDGRAPARGHDRVPARPRRQATPGRHRNSSRG
jgi:pyruvate/2-oxoglutarate dehydrogenase complex dihydrolipoamide acyltransferase (E2) component